MIGEALVAGVPILASRIAGSIGILGQDYAGYFEVGDTRELSRLILRAETDQRFVYRLRTQCAKLTHLFDPAREEQAWTSLLDELV